MDLDYKKRLRLVNNIITGIRFFRIDGFVYSIIEPSLKDVAYSELIYQEKFDQCKYEDWWTFEQYEFDAIQKGLLDKDYKIKMSQMEQTIDNFKLELFNTIVPTEEDKIRQKLKIMRRNYDKLLEPLSSIIDKTVEGIAEVAANQYLLSKSICDSDLQPINEEHLSGKIFNKLMMEYKKNMIDNNTLRYLARTEPWRTHWSIYKPNPFVNKKCLLSQERRVIILYSKMYDSVYESIDCPDDKIINDDDKLDGWFIFQKQKHEKERSENKRDSLADKHGDAQQVFVFAPDKSAAKRIDDMNSPQSKQIKHIRAQQINAAGKLKHAQLADVQQELQIQQTQLMKENIKNRRRR